MSDRKTLMLERDDYQQFVRVSDTSPGIKQVVFSSADNYDGERVLFQTFMTAEELCHLSQFLVNEGPCDD